jgi:hypothetical protein
MSVTTVLRGHAVRDGDADADIDVFSAGRVRDRGAVVVDLLVRAGPSSVTRVVAGCYATWAVSRPVILKPMCPRKHALARIFTQLYFGKNSCTIPVTQTRAK